METISYFVRQCDYFGVGINFNYKSDKKYKSIIGGIIFIIFIIISITYSIISVYQFFMNRPLTVTYYKKELSKTDIYSFSQLRTGLAFKAVCEGIENTDYDIEKLFTLNIVFCKTERVNGQRVKSRTEIPLKVCTHNDFYNEVNETMDLDGLTGYYLCPNLDNYTVSGIYVDSLFEYFEVTLSLSNDIDNETVTKLLYEKECKLSYYFTDYGVNVNNKTHPFNPYANQNFIQLSPVEYKKANLFFNIIEFTSYENFFFNMESMAVHKKYGAFSKLESYELYKGVNRYEKKNSDYKYYAKMYIRVDTSRTVFQRRYEQLDTLFANISSPLSCILMVLFIIATYLNNIFIVNSVIKTIYRTKDDDFIRKQKLREIFKKKINCQIIDNKELKESKRNFHPKLEINKDSFDSRSTDIIQKSKKIDRDFSLNESATIDEKIPKIKKIINNLILNSICQFFPCSKNMNWEFRITSGLSLLFYEQLDIYNYLKSLQMIKIMNYITLNRSEFYLVKYLSNPSISWKIKDFYHLKKDKKDNTDNQINDFWITFEQLLNKKKKSLKEKKICKLISSDVNNMLEK